MRNRYPTSSEHPNDDYWHAVPEDSYCRELDSRVQATERPYGYSDNPPPADSGNFDMRAYGTKNQHRPRK